MRRLFVLILAFANAGFMPEAQSAETKCDRSVFTKDELSNPYSAFRKTTRTLSEAESRDLTKKIVATAINESKSSMACLPMSGSCFGSDQLCTYRTQLSVDSFGQPAGHGGDVVSREFTIWPAGEYYSHQTQVGYSCAWNDNRAPECKRWCSLIVVDDRFHD